VSTWRRRFVVVFLERLDRRSTERQPLLIPTPLVLALLGGLVLPRRAAWVVAAVTVAWVVLLLIDGTREISQLMGGGGGAFGALNAAVGAAAAWAIRRPRTQ